MRRPRPWLYVLAWAALLVAALFDADWRQWDWRLYAHLPGRETPRFSARIELVDVPYSADLGPYRTRLAQTLRALATRVPGVPHVVALDVAIGRDSVGLDELTAAIRALQSQGTRVVAAVNPQDPRTNRPNPDFMDEHARALYAGGVLDGFGHTRFDGLSGTFKYDSHLRIGGLRLPMLAVKIAELEHGRSPPPGRHPTLLHLGDRAEVQARTLDLAGLLAANPRDERYRAKLVIVGSLAEDVHRQAPASGPEMLAWALSDLIAPADSAGHYELVTSPAWLLGVLLAATLVTAAAMGAVYARVPLADNRLWLMPAAGVAAGLLFLLGLLLMLAGLGHIYPQVSLPALGAAAAAGLGWLYARRHLKWWESGREMGEEESAYDIFVSYSRSTANAEWVRTHVYEPLRTATRPDGEPLRVFFDTEAIRPGQAWFRRLAQALHNSRCVVPVFSDDYFAKRFCRYELDLANSLQVAGKIRLIPLLRTDKPVPAVYTGLQWIDARGEGDFLASLLAGLADEATPPSQG